MSEFVGFPRELFSYFENLKNNNSKEWFEGHRKDYEKCVLHPSREFVIEMGKKLPTEIIRCWLFKVMPFESLP